MKLVYIAGPYRAATPWKVEQNIRRAEEAAIRVAKAGAMPVVPHTMTRYWNGCAEEEFWLDGTVELMRRCDGVALITGWYNSSGSKEERAEAEKLGLPVFDCELNGDMALREWVTELQLPEARKRHPHPPHPAGGYPACPCCGVDYRPCACEDATGGSHCPDPCRYDGSRVCAACALKVDR